MSIALLKAKQVFEGGNGIRSTLIMAFVAYLSFYAIFFAPAFLGDASFLSGDTILQYYPAIVGPWSVWSDTLMSGYPVFADSQAMTWYPLRLLGAGLSFDCFIVSAYVVASFFSFCLVRHMTGSSAAAAVAGLCYGLSGFLFAHIGHATILHSAAWLPMILWSVRRLSDAVTGRWIGIGALAVCLSFLAGHPQIFVDCMSMSGAYCLFLLIEGARQRRQGLLRLAGAYAAMFVLGLGLSAIQILPLLEIAPLSLRAELNAETFTSYAMQAVQWPIVAFPALMGGFGYRWPNYFGTGDNLVEVTCYFGLSTLVLIAFAWTRPRARMEVLFWTAIALLAFVYGFGTATPLGRAAYHLPVLSKFRAPARMDLLLIMAATVLVGRGTADIVSGSVSRRRAVVSLAIAGVAVSLLTVGAALDYPAIQVLARASHLDLPLFVLNPAVDIPLGATLAMSLVAIWALKRRSRSAVAAMLAILLLDLGSFGWLGYWRIGPVAPPTIDEPVWAEVRASLAEGGRILSLSGIDGPTGPATPNLNQLFRFPETTGYGPLVLARYVEATGMSIYASMNIGANASLADLLDVRWLAAAGKVGDGNEPVNLGRTCGYSTAGPLRAILPVSVAASRIEVVSSLGCSTDTPDDQQVLGIDVESRNGSIQSFFLEAGRDTSEWAIDKPSVRPSVKHRRASVVSSVSAGDFDAHRYGAGLALDGTEGERRVSSVTLRLPPNAPVVTLFSITLVDEATGERHPIPSWRFQLGDGVTWGAGTATKSGTELFRRQTPGKGIAWLVSEMRRDAPAAVAAATRTGRFADGTPFSPAQTALLEEALPALPDVPPGRMPERLGQGTVTVRDHTPGHWRLDVDADGPAFMVMSQTDYPGWSATINGNPTTIHSVNHAFQGIALPAGQTAVVLDFASSSLQWGGTITGAVSVIVLWLIGGPKRRPKSRTPGEAHLSAP